MGGKWCLQNEGTQHTREDQPPFQNLLHMKRLIKSGIAKTFSFSQFSGNVLRDATFWRVAWVLRARTDNRLRPRKGIKRGRVKKDRRKGGNKVVIEATPVLWTANASRQMGQLEMPRYGSNGTRPAKHTFRERGKGCCPVMILAIANERVGRSRIRDCRRFMTTRLGSRGEESQSQQGGGGKEIADLKVGGVR